MTRTIRTRTGGVESGRAINLVARRQGITAKPTPTPTARVVSVARPRSQVSIPTPTKTAYASPVMPSVVEAQDIDETVLMDILQRARFDPRPARVGKYLHVSDLLSKCLRRIAIIEQHKLVPPPQKLSLMDSLTFDVGDTIHDVIKARVVQGAPSQVWGNWECKCGCTKTTEPSTHDEIEQIECPSCKGHLSTYVEVPMIDDELDVVGTPDLLLRLADSNAFFVTELKSIADAQWTELVRPKPDHVLQVLMYWYLMKKLGYRMVNKVAILYVTKGYKFQGSPCKEFNIDPGSIIERLDMYLDMARELKAHRKSGTLPARVVCPTDRAPEAKKCDVCSICFGGGDAAPTKVSISSALNRPAVRR